MPVAEKVVVVPYTCHACKRQMEIHCQFEPGFSVMNFYRIDCPHCEAVSHAQMPGVVADVFKPGDSDSD